MLDYILLFTLLCRFCSVIQFSHHRRCVKSPQQWRKSLGHWSGEMAGDKTTSEDVRSSRVIRAVFLALLLDLLGFTLILPLLPSILDHYSQTGVRSTFRVRLIIWIFCCYEISKVVWLAVCSTINAAVFDLDSHSCNYRLCDSGWFMIFQSWHVPLLMMSV